MNAQSARSLGLLVSQQGFYINLDWLRVCEGNVARAAVLWAYMWRDREEGPSQVIRFTEEQIAEALCSAFDVQTIRGARRWLTEKRILSIQRGPHNACLCRINRDHLAALVAENAPQVNLWKNGASDESGEIPGQTLDSANPVRGNTRTESGEIPGQTLDSANPVRGNTRTLIGSKNGGGYNNRNNHHAAAPLSVENPLYAAILSRVENLEIPGEPERPVRRIWETLNGCPEWLQRRLLEKLATLTHRIRIGQKRDVESWGYLSDTVAIWHTEATRPRRKPHATAGLARTEPSAGHSPPLTTSTSPTPSVQRDSPNEATRSGGMMSAGDVLKRMAELIPNHPALQTGSPDVPRKGAASERPKSMGAAASG